MGIKYIVNLSDEERSLLWNITSKGKTSGRIVKRAQILLLADEGHPDETIATMLKVGESTVHRTRQRCVEEGVENALRERPHSGRKRQLDGKTEAFLVATACSDAPSGRESWTMQLLADRLVELNLVETLAGWRHIKVTHQRTAQDFAECMKDLVDVFFPKALMIRVVLDNLNTHTPAALYQTFPPDEARRILRKLEFHYTPKHGSWLNMVEIELSVLSRQCLNRRIPDRETMKRETAIWAQERNQQHATVNWRFSNQNARVKLERLYPQLNLS